MTHLMYDSSAARRRSAVLLMQGSKEEQRRLINTLYTADSTFSHPFVDCRVSLSLVAHP